MSFLKKTNGKQNRNSSSHFVKQRKWCRRNVLEDSSRFSLGMNLTKVKDVSMTTPLSTPQEKKKPQSPAATSDIAQKEANQLTELHQMTMHLEIRLETVVSGSPLISLQSDLKERGQVSNSQISINFLDHKLQSFSCDSNY
ncbi:uncharacterized protein LOC119644337 [Glossina fuscipes]|uniref:Uncharacterized protein LOC119644337 n=1 Tax=Glossina fuscipes TaxID=7396 RepID=A0A9C6E189_9MUSC|nr:uncharacterized protein LOC119644337 [Glossina fuscipes]